MARYTFVGKEAGKDEPLRTLYVTLYDMDGGIVIREEFIIGVPDIGIKYVKLPPGEYSAWARADGVKFPWRQHVTLPPADDSDPQVIELIGESTFKRDNSYSVLVTGRLTSTGTSHEAGKAPVSHSATVYNGYSRTPIYQNLNIIFQLKHDGSRSEGTLLNRGILKVGADRNGYFEAELKPDSVYEVSLPYSAPRIFKSHSVGVRELDELISESANKHLFRLI